MWRYSALLGSGGGGGSPAIQSVTAGSYGLGTTQTTISTSASANTKGGYATFGTLTSAIDELYLSFTGNGTRCYQMDVRTGGASEIVTNLPIYLTQACSHARLPIHIPAGLLEINLSANVGSASLAMIGFGLVSNVTETATLIEPIGAVNANPFLSGIAVTPDLAAGPPVWAQINASATVNDYKGIIPFVGTNNKNSSRTASVYVLELGTGPGIGSVTSLGIRIVLNGTISALTQDRLDPIRQAFPAGTIFWARITSLTANATGDTCNVQLHGWR